jgi:hypothetical protein
MPPAAVPELLSNSKPSLQLMSMATWPQNMVILKDTLDLIAIGLKISMLSAVASKSKSSMAILSLYFTTFGVLADPNCPASFIIKFLPRLTVKVAR